MEYLYTLLALLSALVALTVATVGASPPEGGSSEPNRTVDAFEVSTVPVDALTSMDQTPLFAPLRGHQNRMSQEVRLGEMLFFDERLSADTRTSCASCHSLPHAGANPPRAERETSRVSRLAAAAAALGVTSPNDASAGPRNTPGLFNLAGQTAYLHDARATTLERLLDGVGAHPDQLSNDWPRVVAQLSDDSLYAALFDEAFDGPPTRETAVAALTAYLRTLVSRDAPYDRFRAGEREALSRQAARGERRFAMLGCVSCHQGPDLGGLMLQPLGVYVDRLNAVPISDGARYAGVLKVPSLRNVAVTGPYLHDGSVATLPEAVRVMGALQLGVDLSANDVADITAFLEALTGESLPYQRAQ